MNALWDAGELIVPALVLLAAWVGARLIRHAFHQPDTEPECARCVTRDLALWERELRVPGDDLMSLADEVFPDGRP